MLSILNIHNHYISEEIPDFLDLPSALAVENSTVEGNNFGDQVGNNFQQYIRPFWINYSKNLIVFEIKIFSFYTW